ncbi:MAG: GNAT family N-acetyltransferase [Anaerolineales bacterium]|nr:GNAT family N-acetyltransferase [Anaerolineales bacterium]
MIRPYREEDFEAVTQFWFDAMEVAMPGLAERLGHDLAGAREYFKNVVSVENQLWVYEVDTIPVAYLGLQEQFVDRLYVNPAYHRRGIGQALLDYARTLSPHHLWLYTHRANTNARSFYEKNDFVAEKFGVSPAPESEPDVEYHWRAKH